MGKDFKEVLKETSLSKDSRKFILAIKEEAGSSNKYKDSDTFCDMAEKIGKKFEFPVLGIGTNRIVLENDDGNVLKVAHSKMGFVDNNFELLISKFVEAGKIKSKGRLALTETHVMGGSSFVIEQEKEKCLSEHVKEDEGGKKGYNAVKYICKNIEDYHAMIVELSEDFFICDAHIRRPFNFGVRNGKLVVLDYGYFIPLLALEGLSTESGFRVKKKKIYCSCASEDAVDDKDSDYRMVYVIPKVDDDDRATIEKITKTSQNAEKYLCKKCNNVIIARELHEELLDALYEENRKKNKKKK